MVKKIKSSSCGPSWCQNHLFQLNPLKSGLYFKKKLKLRLCPKLNKAYNTFDKALPILNHDKKHYTPLFILEQQKKFYSEHDQRALTNHQRLIEKEQQDQSYFTIYQPKHGGQKPYCSVCEKGYSDYMNHIISHDHKKNLQNSIFTRYIMQIQQNFKKTLIHKNDLKQTLRQISCSPNGSFQVLKVEAKRTIPTQQDFDSLKSINTYQKPMDIQDKLPMQHIESNYIDTQSLKQLDYFL